MAPRCCLDGLEVMLCLGWEGTLSGKGHCLGRDVVWEGTLSGKGHFLAKLFVVTSPLASGESMWLLFADL